MSQKVQTTQTLISELMDKQNVAYTHNEILFVLKRIHYMLRHEWTLRTVCYVK